MGLCKFTLSLPAGQPVWVNPEQVVGVRPHLAYTRIILANGEEGDKGYVTVTEASAIVAQLIHNEMDRMRGI